LDKASGEVHTPLRGLINNHMNRVVWVMGFIDYFSTERDEMLDAISTKEANQMSRRFLIRAGLVGGILFLLITFLGGPALAQKNGAKVEPNLYHVHTRVLWDLGWLTNDTYLNAGPFFTYFEDPKPLVYGPGRTTFLSPLEGYGIPEPPKNAYRKVRLYVTYGHQLGCGGTPTVRIVSGGGQVEFSLPLIGGYYGDAAANWSDFKDLSEYQGIGHAQIQVYQKDFVVTGGDCGPPPGTGPDRPKGVVYKIEAYFYDGYGKSWKP